MEIINDDLLNAMNHNIFIIAQQCNCLSKNTKGLSQSISNRLGIDPYAHRKVDSVIDKPGTVNLMYTNPNFIVANMFAQYHPGKSRYSTDTKEKRLNWFRECCKSLRTYLVHNNITKIGVPYGIGCGLAGGNWTEYEKILENELPQSVLFKN